MLISLALAATLAAEPSTTDLRFMVGEWRLEAAFNPGTAQELKETGTRRCAITLGDAYVRCDWILANERGKVRELVSYHNYNRLYRRFEHLYVASNWPTKVVGTSDLARHGERRSMTIDIRFVLPDGREEQIRSLESHVGDRFESDEQMRVGSDGVWRTNIRITGLRLR